ncbi:uncharacterized protein LOC134578756 [Pelobates fuscus]|uniref:uncharacterized protein LOC134578756 n=1 Tax=Pelobates fuscus TaxID=191477 RepID=UPI002FE4E7B6
MRPHNFQKILVIYISLLSCTELLGSDHVNSVIHGKDLQDSMTLTRESTLIDCSNQTIALVVYPLCPNPEESNFVWTDSITERNFGSFRFGIGLSKNKTKGSKSIRESITPLTQVQSNEPVYVTVTAETNRSDTMLIIISCQLVSKRNKVKTYIIQDGCLDSRTAEEIKGEYNKRVFILRPSGLPHGTDSSMVFVSCEVKLCLSTNQSQPCGSNCPVTVLVHQPINSLMETETYHVTAKPIYVIRESRRVAATNYTALVVGLVLGGTVVAVVVLLVRKSFSGVRQRSVLMDL